MHIHTYMHTHSRTHTCILTSYVCFFCKNYSPFWVHQNGFPTHVYARIFAHMYPKKKSRSMCCRGIIYLYFYVHLAHKLPCLKNWSVFIPCSKTTTFYETCLFRVQLLKASEKCMKKDAHVSNTENISSLAQTQPRFHSCLPNPHHASLYKFFSHFRRRRSELFWRAKCGIWRIRPNRTLLSASRV